MDICIITLSLTINADKLKLWLNVTNMKIIHSYNFFWFKFIYLLFLLTESFFEMNLCRIVLSKGKLGTKIIYIMIQLKINILTFISSWKRANSGKIITKIFYIIPLLECIVQTTVKSKRVNSSIPSTNVYMCGRLKSLTDLVK